MLKMKQIGLLLLTAILTIGQIQAQSKKSTDEMVFDKTVNGITSHDYGSIVYGANGKVDFNFTNKGAKPLVITDVKSSCGCTVPSWTKDPVAPGKTGTITIEYNTTLPGVFNKTVVVYSNASNSPVRLEVRGKVNTQASDLKPGKTQKGAPKQLSVEELGEVDQSVPQDSASKAQAEIASKARQAAQQESFKKLLEKPSPPKKVDTTKTSVPVSKPGTTNSGKKK
jgi:hypothetical protein